jgi:CDP-2,3-bis-(O-geranylgeranyl)-sn-glycerol synthase
VENLFQIILVAVYFMMPAYIANAIPVIANHFNWCNFIAKPIDFNLKFFNKPLFGHSKTFRGFVFGISGAFIIGIVQYYLYRFDFFKQISLLDYSLFNSVLLSFLLGFGALFGDLVKSFIKRRLGFKSGQPWPIFDQIDYPLGAILFASVLIVPSFEIVLLIVFISAIFSILSNIMAFYCGIKKVWW